jgi:hypothetical protein
MLAPTRGQSLGPVSELALATSDEHQGVKLARHHFAFQSFLSQMKSNPWL